MEDQGKRLLITVALVAVLYFVWMKFFTPTPPPPAPRAPAVATAPAPAAGTANAPATAGGEAAAAVDACDPAKEEQQPRFETAEYVATFSRCGGALSSFTLKGEQYRAGKAGEKGQIDVVHAKGNSAYFPLQLQVDMPAAGSGGPDERRQPIIPAKATWTLVSTSDDGIVFRWT